MLQHQPLKNGEKMTKKEFFKKLSDCVVNMAEDSIVDTVKEYIESSYDPLEGMLSGLVDGVKCAIMPFGDEEYYISERLVCFGAVNNGMEVYL